MTVKGTIANSAVEMPATVSASGIGVTASMDISYSSTEDANLTSGEQMLDGVTAYSHGVKYTGNIPLKQAQTYTPGTTDQVIQPRQYIAGEQTIKGDTNLAPENIRAGVSLFSIVGTMTTPTVTYDPVTHTLTIR